MLQEQQQKREMSDSRDASSICAEIQRHLRSQSPHALLLPPITALSACAPPRGSSDSARFCAQLAATFSAYLNNWASLADGSCFAAFTRAIGMLPAHSSLVALLTTLKQCVTIDGAQLVVQLVSRAFKPSALDDAFRSLIAAPDPRASAEDLFRLVCHAPSAAAAVLKQQAPLWFDAGIFVPAFITAAFLKLAAANAGLLELVMSQSCVQGYMRHALAALEAIIEAGSDFTQTMQGAVAAMKLPVLLRVVDHTVHCCRYRRAHRAVLAAVLCLPPSHAAISYLSTDLWRQRSLTHTAACALVDLLLSTCGDFSAEPLKTVLHCLGDLFARESFATSALESHHFAVCAALRRMLMAPNSKFSSGESSSPQPAGLWPTFLPPQAASCATSVKAALLKLTLRSLPQRLRWMDRRAEPPSPNAQLYSTEWRTSSRNGRKTLPCLSASTPASPSLSQHPWISCAPKKTLQDLLSPRPRKP